LRSAAIDGFGRTFVEAHELDEKTASKINPEEDDRPHALIEGNCRAARSHWQVIEHRA
jgi:hypothetical protein